MNKVFISYSHKDEEWKDRLVTHLRVLEMEGYCSLWDDKKIKAGDDWLPDIENTLNEAQIIIMMISADFLISDFISGMEVPRALERRRKEGVRVIPIMVKPCAWKTVKWLSAIQLTPKDGKPLSTKKEHEVDEELAKLAEEIISLIKIKPEDKTGPKGPAFFSKPEKISIFKLPITGEFLFGREKELKSLDEAWADAHIHIVTLVAWGGVGKTALVNRWLNRMEKDNYRGANRVYAWSFYSQGAEEGKQASADEFMQETLLWFGDPDPTAGSAVGKGRRLARLVRDENTLLILDGMEPLQYPPGQVHGLDGKLKDPGMRAFLRELAGGFNGLCIITSREKVTDLSDKKEFAVKEMELDHLSFDACAELLKRLGVKGSDKDILKAAEEYDGHALALTLLGQYITSVYRGDIRKRDRIPHLAKERIQGGHARRVMEAYERWLGQSAEKDILYIMGLFDRPVDIGAIEALKAEPAIPSVTDQLVSLSEEDWNRALFNLRAAHLLAVENPQKRDVLDCHPLIREHFGEKLKEKNKKGWKESHKRLYIYFKELPEKELPDTLQEMEPLFAAVAHGCRAGLHEEARFEVYFKRISRENEHYIKHKLGAFGADLSALSNFYEKPWTRLAAGLPDREKAVILSWTAFGLRALGRLREAIQPMKASFELMVELKEWKQSAIAASNLSELMLTLGEVKEAVEYGSRSVTHADRSGDADWKYASRTAHADALHQRGQLEEAEALFREAEALQRERQPEYTFLYSLRGYQFCDLLLGQDQNNYQEVMERAEKALELVTKVGDLLSIALDNLTLGRAWMIKAEKEGIRNFRRALDYLDRAVEGLREAGTQNMLPLALLARAACFRLQENFSSAWEDLSEAKEIAELGEMKLHLVNYHIEAARVSSAEGKDEDARLHFETAGKMIKETGYHRRDEEIECLKCLNQTSRNQKKFEARNPKSETNSNDQNINDKNKVPAGDL
jgi:tetratricopeptide (TPR) repeat protein